MKILTKSKKLVIVACFDGWYVSSLIHTLNMLEKVQEYAKYLWKLKIEVLFIRFENIDNYQNDNLNVINLYFYLFGSQIDISFRNRNLNRFYNDIMYCSTAVIEVIRLIRKHYSYVISNKSLKRKFIKNHYINYEPIIIPIEIKQIIWLEIGYKLKKDLLAEDEQEDDHINAILEVVEKNNAIRRQVVETYLYETEDAVEDENNNTIREQEVETNEEYLQYSKLNEKKTNRLFEEYSSKLKGLKKIFMSRQRISDFLKGKDSYEQIYAILTSIFGVNCTKKMCPCLLWIQKYFKIRDKLLNEIKIPQDRLKFKVYPEFVTYIGPTIGSSVCKNAFEYNRFEIENFEKEKVYHFPIDGEDLEFQNVKHRSSITIYAPEVFSLLQTKFDESYDQYKSSIYSAWQRMPNRGRSHSSIYQCGTDYVIKTVLKNEFKLFEKFLSTYLYSFVAHQHTFLPKFYGIYKNKTKNNSKVLVVMRNVFDQFYDLKYEINGCLSYTPGNTNTDSTILRGEEDIFYRHYGGFGMLKTHYDLFFNTLTRDLETLEEFRIIEYSLLMGVFYFPEDDIDSDVCQYFHEKLNMGISIGDLKIPAWTLEGRRVYLKCGLIDILKTYSERKKLEHIVHTVFTNKHLLAACPPELYKDRLLKFLRSIIHSYTGDPSKFTKLNTRLNLRL